MARPRCSTRLWVEQFDSGSVRHLRALQPYLTRELSRQFSEGKPLVFCSIALDICGQPFNVQVTADRPHYGGVRLWFLCPRCSRRVLKVYQWPGVPVLGCRHCFGLVYGQQMRKGRGIRYSIERFLCRIYDSNPWRFVRECEKWQRQRNRRSMLLRRS